MRLRKRVLAWGAVALLTATTGIAGSAIDNVTVQSVGTGPWYDAACGYTCMVVEFSTAPTASPCSLNAGWHYAIDVSTQGGRVTAAQILAAKAAGSSVQAGGSGTCVYLSRIEQLSYIILK